MLTKNLAQFISSQQKTINVIYISSYIPRKCGIATYTKDLTNAINLLNSRSLAEILVINKPDENVEYPWEAKFKVTDHQLSDFLEAANYINRSGANIVSLQHEFGLYGGNAGEYIVHLVEALTIPLVTTFHTVVDDPNSNYGNILRRIANRSKAIVVMMENAAEKLVNIYEIPRDKIVVIPHGVPDLPLNDTEKHKRKRQLTNRIVLGNINLLSNNKGIEYALEAIAQVAQKYPQVLYICIGQTHPNILRIEGEKYRNYLKRIIRRLGIGNNVRFVNEYLPLTTLIDWLKTIDIYITPYLDPQQVTSGALAYAIGAGKACVSTPYIYAQEVLSDERGVLVPFRDSAAIAEAILKIIENPAFKKETELKAYAFGRLMTWPNVAQSHLNLLRAVVTREENTTNDCSPTETEIPDNNPTPPTESQGQ